MRIAIVGAGISGLVTAELLRSRHEITLFEAAARIGGHTNTVRFEHDGAPRAIDTGFIVYNEKNYPHFSRLLRRLGVDSRPTTMGFSVRSDPQRLEYNGDSLNTLFAQRTNLFRPRFHRMVRDILRFYRDAEHQIDDSHPDASVDDFVRRHRYGAEFVRDHLVPMGSALWSCPAGRFLDFPIRFVVEFFANHNMLQVSGRPPWRTIRGGSDRYVNALVKPFRDRIRLSADVRSVRRAAGGVEVATTGHEPERFDEVVFACHADQSLRVLDDPTPREREILGAFPYQRNDAVLHTDVGLLPRRRRAWASWNYHVTEPASELPTVTYWMNELQSLPGSTPYLVTLNRTADIDPARVLRSFVYHHPIYTARSVAAQKRHAEIDGANGVHFCGAYWSWGFHEDGVKSAQRVSESIRSEALV